MLPFQCNVNSRSKPLNRQSYSPTASGLVCGSIHGDTFIPCPRGIITGLTISTCPSRCADTAPHLSQRSGVTCPTRFVAYCVIVSGVLHLAHMVIVGALAEEAIGEGGVAHGAARSAFDFSGHGGRR